MTDFKSTNLLPAIVRLVIAKMAGGGVDRLGGQLVSPQGIGGAGGGAKIGRAHV